MNRLLLLGEGDIHHQKQIHTPKKENKYRTFRKNFAFNCFKKNECVYYQNLSRLFCQIYLYIHTLVAVMMIWRKNKADENISKCHCLVFPPLKICSPSFFFLRSFLKHEKYVCCWGAALLTELQTRRQTEPPFQLWYSKEKKQRKEKQFLHHFLKVKIGGPGLNKLRGPLICLNCTFLGKNW